MGTESAGISVTLDPDLQLCPYAHTRPQRLQLYRPFSIPWHLSLHLLDRVFSQSRHYDIMVLSDLAKGGLESGYGLMNTTTKTKTKNNITKSMSLLFFLCIVSLQKPCNSSTLLLLPSWT